MGRMGLLAAETCCEGHVLEPRWADQSPPLAIEMLATRFTGERHDALRRLAEDVRRIWLELYDELLAREEPDPEAAALADVQRLAGERDHVQRSRPCARSTSATMSTCCVGPPSPSASAIAPVCTATRPARTSSTAWPTATSLATPRTRPPAARAWRACST